MEWKYTDLRMLICRELRPRDVGRTGDWKGRRWSSGLGLGEVASISLAREESQESCRKRLKSRKGLCEAKMNPQSKAMLSLSVPYLAGLLSYIRQWYWQPLPQLNRSVEGVPDSRCLSGKWEVAEKMFSISVSAFSVLHFCSSLGPVWEFTASLVSLSLQQFGVYCSLAASPIRMETSKMRGSGNMEEMLLIPSSW